MMGRLGKGYLVGQSFQSNKLKHLHIRYILCIFLLGSSVHISNSFYITENSVEVQFSVGVMLLWEACGG